MALSYDFDMFSVFPKASFEDPEVGRMLAEMGFSVEQRANQVALFREARTLAALRRAPEPVQAYLRAAGFGLNTYHSGAPPGRYPAEDEVARTALIEALAEGLSRHRLPKADAAPTDPDAFHLPSFFEAVMRAEPLPADTPLAAPVLPAAPPVPSPPRSDRRLRLPGWLSRLRALTTAGTRAIARVASL